MKKKSPPAPPQKAPKPPVTAPPTPAAQTPTSVEPAKATPASSQGDASQVPATQPSSAPVSPTGPASVPPPRLGREQLLPSPGMLSPAPQLKIDWAGMHSNFRLRGVSMEDRDAAAVEQHWSMAYRQISFLNEGLGLDLAPKSLVWLTNKATSLAVDTALSRDNPTRMEMFNRDLEKMLPPGQKLPTPIILPIFSKDF